MLSVCAAGYEGSGSPGAGCTACTTGKFKDFAGDYTCSDCPPGSFSPALGATACTDCVADTYSATWGQPACDSCAIPNETTDTLRGQASCGRKLMH